MIHIKHMFVLITFLLQGCSWNPFVTESEFNTVTVVKHSPYLKYYRAYFEREDLHQFPNGKKYLYLFSKKKRILGLLLHKKDSYLIYNLSHDNKEPIELSIEGNIPYESIRDAYEKEGFYRIRSPRNLGFLIFVSFRQYKKIKTLRFNIKNYSKLQNIYKHAIKSYQANDIRHIKTRLPKRLIRNYYLHYKKRAKTEKEKKALIEIGSKLHLLTKTLKVVPKKSKKLPEKRKKTTTLNKKKHPKKEKNIQSPVQEEDFQDEEIQEYFQDEVIEDSIEDLMGEDAEDFQEEEIERDFHANRIQTSMPIQKEKSIPKNKYILKENITRRKTYTYYLKQSTLNELNVYLSESTTINTLSYTQYNALTQRKKSLSEQRLLTKGSLKELLLAYKLTKDEKYKERIMLIMKNKQEESKITP